MLARTLALQANRLDFWNIPGEHTDYEWACQIAAQQVDPVGERRADLRAAVMTANLMALMVQVHSGKPADDEEFRKTVRALANYLPGKEDFQEIDDMRAVEMLKQEGGA